MRAAQDAGRAQRAEERDALSEAVEGLKQIDPLLQAVAAVPWLMATGVRGTEAGSTGPGCSCPARVLACPGVDCAAQQQCGRAALAPLSAWHCMSYQQSWLSVSPSLACVACRMGQRRSEPRWCSRKCWTRLKRAVSGRGKRAVIAVCAFLLSADWHWIPPSRQTAAVAVTALCLPLLSSTALPTPRLCHRRQCAGRSVVHLAGQQALPHLPSISHPSNPNTPAGFDVRGAVRRIWLGSRDAHMLMMGKDAGSAAAIKQILFHAQQYDDKFGKQTYSPKSAS